MLQKRRSAVELRWRESVFFTITYCLPAAPSLYRSTTSVTTTCNRSSSTSCLFETVHRHRIRAIPLSARRHSAISASVISSSFQMSIGMVDSFSAFRLRYCPMATVSHLPGNADRPYASGLSLIRVPRQLSLPSSGRRPREGQEEMKNRCKILVDRDPCVPVEDSRPPARAKRGCQRVVTDVSLCGKRPACIAALKRAAV